MNAQRIKDCRRNDLRIKSSVVSSVDERNRMVKRGKLWQILSTLDSLSES